MFIRDGNYAKILGELFLTMKQERLAGIFNKLAANAKPPPQNLASVLLSLAEYCSKANMIEDCIKACERVIDIGNGQQREAAKSIRNRFIQTGH